MKQNRYWVVAIAAILCAGCFPAQFTKRPGVQGVVVDDTTGRPLANASVVVYRLDWDYAASARPRTLKPTGEPARNCSNADGRFDLPCDWYWGVYIIPADVLAPGARLEVAATGFATYRRDYVPRLNGGSTFDAGTIRLRRQID
jgi:hypothetical protein